MPSRRRIEPVDPANEQDEAGGDENSEQPLPDDIPHETAPQLKCSVVCEYALGVYCGVEEGGRIASQDTWDRDFIRKAKMLEIEDRERNQQPEKNHP